MAGVSDNPLPVPLPASGHQRPGPSAPGAISAWGHIRAPGRPRASGPPARLGPCPLRTGSVPAREGEMCGWLGFDGKQLRWLTSLQRARVVISGVHSGDGFPFISN